MLTLFRPGLFWSSGTVVGGWGALIRPLPRNYENIEAMTTKLGGKIVRPKFRIQMLIKFVFQIVIFVNAQSFVVIST